MKKIILILTTLALLAVTPPLQSSWYNTANPYSTTGLALHNNLGWQSFGVSSFETRMDGFYRLELAAAAFPFSYDELFVTSYAGLVKLTGSCYQTKPSNITLRMWTDGQPQPVTLAETNAARFVFVQVFMAGNFLLQGYNNDLGRYDVLKCSLLIEKVQ